MQNLNGSEELVIKIKCTSPDYLPIRMTTGAVGYDCKSAIDIYIQPNQSKIIPLGFSVELPPGIEGQIRPRSGLSSELVVCNLATIDFDYRGTVHAMLINFSDKVICIRNGDRIAQLVFNEVRLPKLNIVESLSNTTRGDSGFGSTGSN